MMDKEFDQLLKNALFTEFQPDDELNIKIMRKARENKMINMKRMRKFTAAAILCVLLGCTVTGFAAWKFLMPQNVALECRDKELAKAFESKDAVIMNESQTYGGYNFTLLGAVSGEFLKDFCSAGNQVSTAKTYAVVAIAKTDGAPMPKTSEDSYGKEPLFISPLIQGLNPKDYNIVTMNGGYSEIVRDGIMYRIIECDNIEMFADKALYLCISNTNFFETAAYSFDEKTGVITSNSSYKGMKLLFDLPLKTNKADKKAAEQYLKNLSLAAEREMKENKGDNRVMEVDINEIREKWTLISEKKVIPDKEGRIYYSYEGKSGSGEGFVLEEVLFDKGQTGYSQSFEISESDNWKSAVLYYRDKQGEVIVSVYEIEK
ncbi:MAG: hypothetical protein E7222_08590 [Clostridiales bacterium]|nr:hypothetical protein [Clostridiales bacterium]